MHLDGGVPRASAWYWPCWPSLLLLRLRAAVQGCPRHRDRPSPPWCRPPSDQPGALARCRPGRRHGRARDWRSRPGAAPPRRTPAARSGNNDSAVGLGGLAVAPFMGRLGNHRRGPGNRAAAAASDRRRTLPGLGPPLRDGPPLRGPTQPRAPRSPSLAHSALPPVERRRPREQPRLLGFPGWIAAPLLALALAGLAADQRT